MSRQVLTVTARHANCGTAAPVPGSGRGNPNVAFGIVKADNLNQEPNMGRYMLLWLLGIPIPILLLIWAFGGLN